MPRSLTASTRKTLVRVALALPPGDAERRVILATLRHPDLHSDALAEGFNVDGLTEQQRQEIEDSANRRWDASKDADLIKRALKGDVSEAERKALLTSPYYFDVAKRGSRVAVHLNLGYKKKHYNLKSFSVKENPNLSGRTVAHVPSTVISDATFIVRAGGQKMAEDDGNKTVHAGIIGKYGGMGGGRKTDTQLRYNPHEGMTWFMRQDPETGDWNIPVESAKRVYLTPTGKVGEVWAQGVVDMPEREAAKHRRASRQARQALIRLASALPKGSQSRRTVLTSLVTE